MFDKLRHSEERFERIECELSEPSVAANAEKFRKLMLEYTELSPLVAKYREYCVLKVETDGAEQMMEEESDRALRTLAAEEFKACRERLAVLEHELKMLMIPRDPNDDKNVIVEIRGGAGGEEAALFAAVLYRMYSMYASSVGFRTELLGCNETELGGFKEVTFMVSGNGAYSKFKYESGVHRVQRVPETEAQGRIHTSTATVAVLPEAEEVEIEIAPRDVEIETCKSSGAGGQHINKTESAIRLIHKPTGIVVECQDERSQYKNKDKAFRVLRAKLYDLKCREQNDRISNERKNQVGTGDRSERIRTYNYPQGRVTDHRIGLTLYTLDSFLNGSISSVTEALAAADAAEKLKNSTETM